MFRTIFTTLITSTLMAGAAYADCPRIADADTMGPTTQVTLCDDKPARIRLNVETMQQAPDSMKVMFSEGPAAEIRLPGETIAAEATEGWANDRATNAGLILIIEDPAEAKKLGRAINAGEAFDIVLVDENGTEFTAFSGTFAMRFPEDILQ